MTPLQAFGLFTISILFGGLWAIVGWQLTSLAYAVGMFVTLGMAFGLIVFTKQTVNLIRRGLSLLRRTDKSPHATQDHPLRLPEGGP